MIKKTSKNELRQIRHSRVRSKIFGTSQTPRLSVFRSNTNISAQIIDDEKGVTLVSSSARNLKLEKTSTLEAAIQVGKDLAKKAMDSKIESVVFDRSGYLYHGRIKALADAARENGLKF